MPMGAGKYDDQCTAARIACAVPGHETECSVALIVFNGQRGNGFSVQGSPDFTFRMADILEDTARQIRASLAKTLQ